MSNTHKTSVCFKCRTVVRRNEFSVTASCANCRQPMIQLSPKFEVPKRTDAKGWRKLQVAATPGDTLAGHYLISSRHDRRR